MFGMRTFVVALRDVNFAPKLSASNKLIGVPKTSVQLGSARRLRRSQHAAIEPRRYFVQMQSRRHRCLSIEACPANRCRNQSNRVIFVRPRARVGGCDEPAGFGLMNFQPAH